MDPSDFVEAYGQYFRWNNDTKLYNFVKLTGSYFKNYPEIDPVTFKAQVKKIDNMNQSPDIPVKNGLIMTKDPENNHISFRDRTRYDYFTVEMDVSYVPDANTFNVETFFSAYVNNKQDLNLLRCLISSLFFPGDPKIQVWSGKDSCGKTTLAQIVLILFNGLAYRTTETNFEYPLARIFVVDDQSDVSEQVLDAYDKNHTQKLIYTSNDVLKYTTLTLRDKFLEHPDLEGQKLANVNVFEWVNLNKDLIFTWFVDNLKQFGPEIITSDVLRPLTGYGDTILARQV